MQWLYWFEDMLSLTADQYLEAEAQKKDLGPAKDSFKRLYKELETGLIPFIEPFVSSTRIFPAYRVSRHF